MKLILPIILGIAAAALAVALFLTRQSDNALLDTANTSINDFSNRLDSAQTQLSERNGSLLIVSNNLVESQSAVLTFSNQLMDAKSAVAAGAEQITNLTRQAAQLADVQALNKTLNRNIMNLTNALAEYAQQLASTKSSLADTNLVLAQAYKDFSLLENRFRIDVAERTVLERKLRSVTELQAQIDKLKKTPAAPVTEATIYAGLDVEVRSNGTVHVITPN